MTKYKKCYQRFFSNDDILTTLAEYCRRNSG